VLPIALSSGARIAEFPDVPTLKDEGYDDLVALTWYALSGPAGLPGNIVTKLNQAVNAAWVMPALRQRLAEDAIVAEPMSPAALTAFVTGEVQKWGLVAKQVMAGP
jgi:tripartite-type tricarboxylate transporter receptor subunit TctC